MDCLLNLKTHISFFIPHVVLVKSSIPITGTILPNAHQHMAYLNICNVAQCKRLDCNKKPAPASTTIYRVKDGAGGP